MLTQIFNPQKLSTLCAFAFGGGYRVHDNETVFVIDHNQQIQHTETQPGLYKKWPWHHDVGVTARPQKDSFEAAIRTAEDEEFALPVGIGFAVTDAHAYFKHGMMNAEARMQNALKAAITAAAENMPQETLQQQASSIAKDVMQSTRDEIAKLGLTVHDVSIKEPRPTQPGRDMNGAVIASTFSMTM